MKLSVLGAGGWGTAVARLLANAGHDTILWARRPEVAEAMGRTRENVHYLPGVALPRERLSVTSDVLVALDADAIFLAVPSFGMNDLLHRIAPVLTGSPTLINLAKGLDRDSQRTMSELIGFHIPDAEIFTLSGPSHAEEVGRDVPTAVVLAGRNLDLGRRLLDAIATPRFRVYLSTDIRGVELCSTVKNIIAIATGIADGLGYGDNSRGALIARGLAEMVRFGRTFGVDDATFFGLSGLGDLVTTCTSRHSRNRLVGERLGRGESLESILQGMVMVAEGIYATRVVREMAQAHDLDMPITEAVDQLLRGEADASSLVDRIMTRSPKTEGF
ncbi:MAG: NAD(P)-dependent glycerol-3-phosphate dehydrogenase [Candidatus Bipolaricaulis sp.]|nr:NAD(P)-dependent glycerol-3-phosphate dehydrogenase [Candidatus Bipolaricaulis sp.]